jgi:putative transposase
MTSTIRLKVKTESYPWLNAAAREVNTTWNWANETSRIAATRTDRLRKWLSGYDLNKLSAGASECFERINADTIQCIGIELATKRRQAKKLRLRWRISGGARKSLGWVPFKAKNLKRHGNALRYAGKTFRVFEIGRLDGVKWRQGCFAQDAVGDWWLSLPVQSAVEQSVAPLESVGIDLGLKAIATTSDGDVLEAGRWMHEAAGKLAQAQRRGHKRQAKRIHRKISRQRQDALHKFSTRIVARYQSIAIGDVSSAKLIKTRMAKSVLDSGWGMLKRMVEYKGEHAGRSVQIVDESYTSRACSSCGSLSGPSGLDMLVVRRWMCADCGESHDRDVNAARNILARSRCAPPSAGTSWTANISAGVGMSTGRPTAAKGEVT